MTTPPVPPDFEEWRRKLQPPPAPSRNPRECRKVDGTPKVAHKSIGAANYAMWAMWAKPDFIEDPKRPLNVYLCSRCQRYHVGRTPKSPEGPS